MNTSRRSFLAQSSAVAAGFSALGKFLNAAETPALAHSPYGPLQTDPGKIIELPKGFSYRVLSRTGDTMNDGFKVPGQPDGMGCFDLEDDLICLVRNHEIGHTWFTLGPFQDNSKLPGSIDPSMSYDPGRFGAQPFVGGTTNVVINQKTGKVVNQYLSLTGTDRNCAGGITPWNSWITCEEPGDMNSKWGKDHGYNFEVHTDSKACLTKPVPLREMGRFRHEAIAVDPQSGIVYQTEDRGDSAIYRFIPKKKGALAAGGRLQALRIISPQPVDTRNYKDSTFQFPLRRRFPVDWIDLDEVESPKDDLRLRAVEKGAAIFTRGEGMWYGGPNEVGEAAIFWACTDGGPKRNGQIFRFFPGEDISGGKLELYLEPDDSSLLRSADNLTVAPSGYLFVCEDNGGPNHIRGVTPEGEIFTFARSVQEWKGGKGVSEFAGACFSPDGNTLFVNIQTPGTTLAITGPFKND